MPLPVAKVATSNDVSICPSLASRKHHLLVSEEKRNYGGVVFQRKGPLFRWLIPALFEYTFRICAPLMPSRVHQQIIKPDKTTPLLLSSLIVATKKTYALLKIRRDHESGALGIGGLLNSARSNAHHVQRR